MELRHLRYFLTLAEELHFGRAAEKLFIAQPPLSRQIKKLEEELSVELFKRTKRNVQLTGYGKYLRDEAIKLFHHVELIKNHIRLLEEGQAGQIKIGYVGSAMHSVLPEILTEIQLKLPEIHLSMIEVTNLDQIIALKTGSLDIAFIRTPVNIDGLYIQPIFSETLSVILPLSHPMAGAEGIRLAHLAKDPFIGFCRDCAPGLFDCIIALCNREGFSPCIVHESVPCQTRWDRFSSELMDTSVYTCYTEGVNHAESNRSRECGTRDKAEDSPQVFLRREDPYSS